MTIALQARETGSTTLQGILAMMLSMAAFVVNDTFVKLASASFPMGEVLFLRAVATAMLCTVLLIAWGPPRAIANACHPRVLLRGLGDVGGTFTFLFALAHMPMADAYAILQFTPLALTAAAAIFLGAPVGWRRWLAAIVGLVGVLIIVRPGGESFNSYSVLALVSIGFTVGRDFITRGIGFNVTSIAIAMISTLMVATVSAFFCLFETWQLPSPSIIAMMLAAGATLLAGQHCLIAALRSGDIVVVTPFRYSIVLWSVLSGLLVWHEFPDRLTLVGIAIVMGAGLYTFLREQALARAGKPR